MSGSFPPSGPTSLLSTIPATLFVEYNDDENVQAFFTAYNQMVQGYVDWFNNVNLPVYTSASIAGNLLDWVGTGLYGMPRPVLSYTTNVVRGALGTYAFGTTPLGASVTSGTSQVYVATDDIYKRILTWNFFKGDGRAFTVQWLKRRILRFLGGINGTNFNIDDTSQVSVAYGSSNTITVTITSGAIPTVDAPVLKAAFSNGVLDIPFQFTFVFVV